MNRDAVPHLNKKVQTPESLVKAKTKEELEDEVLDGAYNFLDKNEDKFKKDYSKLPEDVKSDIFSEKSLEILKNLSTDQRLHIVSRSINNFLGNSPDKANQYLSKFSIDRDIIDKISDIVRSPRYMPDRPEIISITALGMWNKYGNNHLDQKSLSEDRSYDYWLRADRMNHAQKVLLGDGNMSDKFLLDYGELGQKISDKLDVANDLLKGGWDSPNVDDLFESEDFESLKGKDKKELLVKLISYLHNILLYEEVWNTNLSEESVLENNKRIKESKSDLASYFGHSMVYKTHHLNSLYRDKDKEYLDDLSKCPYSAEGPVFEYGFIKLLDASIEKIGDSAENKEEIIDFIIDFWNKNRDPIYGAYVSEALSKLNPNYASSKLLDLVKKEKKDKNHLAAILYRLEFGKIGISQEGVRYLEKMYDLGEFNNENYSVERLTPNGEIGIFDEEEKLIKYFELGNITDEKTNIKAEVLDFVYETLFLPKSNETEDEKKQRLEYLNEFKEKYHKLSQDKIFTETGVYLNNLTFKEQGSFIFYLNDINKSENKEEENFNKEKLTSFVKKYKESGIRTFLSIQQGGAKMGEEIISLAEKLTENKFDDLASIIFDKYGEYIDAVNSVESTINKEYKFPPSLELINKTKESLLIRGKDLLLSQNRKLLDGEFSADKFIKSMENTKVGVDLFKNIFRIVKENYPDTSFEDFAGLNPEHTTSRDQINDEDLLKIDKIFDKNYQNEELRKAVKKSFSNSIESNRTILNLLRRDKDIIALDRIDQKEDGTLYFGSFNVDPDYCSSKIGAAFFEATVLPLMKEKIVRADCSSLQPIASYYIESGFVANKLYNYSGEPSFSLESIPSKSFKSKDLSKTQIVDTFIKNENIDGLIVQSAFSQKEVTEKNIPENYALTRYFFDKNTDKWFTVLEKTN